MSYVDLPHFVQGEALFEVPTAGGKPCKTWYKVSGLKSGIPPLVVLHGGPGCPHQYVEIIAQLTTLFGIPVVLYDQLGNGRSTHLPKKNGDTEFWIVDLFIDELHNLLNHLGIHGKFSMLGQSWGGMLAASFATQQPRGLHKLIIADSPASMQLWMEGTALWRLRLPQDVQDVLHKHEAEGTTIHEDYVNATHVFYENFLCRLKPMPQSLQTSLHLLEEDLTVYKTMLVPPFSMAKYVLTSVALGGTAQTSAIDDLHKINVPTLLVNGNTSPKLNGFSLPTRRMSRTWRRRKGIRTWWEAFYSLIEE